MATLGWGTGRRAKSAASREYRQSVWAGLRALTGRDAVSDSELVALSMQRPRERCASCWLDCPAMAARLLTADQIEAGY